MKASASSSRWAWWRKRQRLARKTRAVALFHVAKRTLWGVNDTNHALPDVAIFRCVANWHAGREDQLQARRFPPKWCARHDQYVARPKDLAWPNDSRVPRGVGRLQGSCLRCG